MPQQLNTNQSTCAIPDSTQSNIFGQEFVCESDVLVKSTQNIKFGSSDSGNEAQEGFEKISTNGKFVKHLH